nr:RNA-directed DNA polymerase, eukaryota, reverse transcriptase zinc-binding domain protein [Tanacetum cinerariifolium]
MDVYVPLKIKLAWDEQMMIVVKKDVDIEKGNSETLRYASFLCKLKKHISFEMGGKCMQLLTNHSLPNFSTRGNECRGRVGISALWVKWVSTLKLKGVSIWVVQKEECDSWGWKNLLTIRYLIMSHVMYKIGNDNVANMIDAGNWKNGSEWVNNVSCLATIPIPVIKQGENNKIIWLDNNGNPIKFIMSNVYDDLRSQSEEIC